MGKENAVISAPAKYNGPEDAISCISSEFAIPLPQWLRSSKLLHELLYQTRLTEYPIS
jgi:hypothetical protein